MHFFGRRLRRALFSHTNPAVLFASLELCVLNRLGCFADLFILGIGRFFVSFWGSLLGIIVGSLWDHFGSLLGSFGDHH